MIEQNPVAAEHAVGLAVIHGDPVRVELGDTVRRTRMEWRRLALRRFAYEPIQLRGRRLIKTTAIAESKRAHRFEDAQRAQAVRIRRVLGLLERNRDMALRGEVVDLVRFDLLNDAQKAQ